MVYWNDIRTVTTPLIPFKTWQMINKTFQRCNSNDHLNEIITYVRFGKKGRLTVKWKQKTLSPITSCFKLMSIKKSFSKSSISLASFHSAVYQNNLFKNFRVTSMNVLSFVSEWVSCTCFGGKKVSAEHFLWQLVTFASQCHLKSARDHNWNIKVTLRVLIQTESRPLTESYSASSISRYMRPKKHSDEQNDKKLTNENKWTKK